MQTFKCSIYLHSSWWYAKSTRTRDHSVSPLLHAFIDTRCDKTQIYLSIMVASSESLLMFCLWLQNDLYWCTLVPQRVSLWLVSGDVTCLGKKQKIFGMCFFFFNELFRAWNKCLPTSQSALLVFFLGLWISWTSHLIWSAGLIGSNLIIYNFQQVMSGKGVALDYLGEQKLQFWTTCHMGDCH